MTTTVAPTLPANLYPTMEHAYNRALVAHPFNSSSLRIIRVGSRWSYVWAS